MQVHPSEYKLLCPNGAVFCLQTLDEHKKVLACSWLQHGRLMDTSLPDEVTQYIDVPSDICSHSRVQRIWLDVNRAVYIATNPWSIYSIDGRILTTEAERNNFLKFAHWLGPSFIVAETAFPLRHSQTIVYQIDNDRIIHRTLCGQNKGSLNLNALICVDANSIIILTFAHEPSIKRYENVARVKFKNSIDGGTFWKSIEEIQQMDFNRLSEIHILKIKTIDGQTKTIPSVLSK